MFLRISFDRYVNRLTQHFLSTLYNYEEVTKI